MTPWKDSNLGSTKVVLVGGRLGALSDITESMVPGRCIKDFKVLDFQRIISVVLQRKTL